MRFAIMSCCMLVAASASAQTMLGCKLVHGDMVSNCDITHMLCSSAFEVDPTTRSVRQVDGLYKSALVEIEQWDEARVQFKQTSEHGVVIRSSLNRLTGELHVRADWVYEGRARERIEVWSCARRQRMF